MCQLFRKFIRKLNFFKSVMMEVVKAEADTSSVDCEEENQNLRDVCDCSIGCDRRRDADPADDRRDTRTVARQCGQHGLRRLPCRRPLPVPALLTGYAGRHVDNHRAEMEADHVAEAAAAVEQQAEDVASEGDQVAQQQVAARAGSSFAAGRRAHEDPPPWHRRHPRGSGTYGTHAWVP